MSACDTCPDPGKCCRDFPLSGIRPSVHLTLLEAMVAAASHVYWVGELGADTRMGIGLPFIPHGRDDDNDQYRWHCVNLLPSGRCGDYKHRPYGPCVLFEPGSSDICVLYEGAA